MSEHRPQDVEARFRAGLEAARSGDIVKARAILSKVVLEKPRSVEAWWWLGQVVEDTNQRIYCYKKVLNLDPSHPGARKKLGLQPLKRGRLGGANDGRSATGSQRRFLILLGVLTLLVIIVGGGYIYLDFTGQLGQILNPPTSLPSPTPVQATSPPTLTAVSLASIPTWTATVSATPQPTQSPPTATEEPRFTSTPQPPTPASLPSVASAQLFDLVTGSGPLTLAPDSFFVMRFEPGESLNLQTVGALVFHAIATNPEIEPTLEIFMWDFVDGVWEPYGVRWGDNPIVNPGAYVDEDATIIAALRNWGPDPIELDNTGFTIGGLNSEGMQLYYGLTRQETLQPTGEATPTQVDLDA